MSYYDHPSSQHIEPAPPAAATPQVARTEAQIAEAFYSKPEPLPDEQLTPELQALRAADPGRAMFGDVSTYSAAGIGEALAAHGVEGRAAEEERRAWSGVLADLDVPAAEAASLVQLARLSPPDEATSAAWQASATESLTRVFGADANQALADAKLLVTRDPRLAKYLDASGLGNHPDVVVKAARIARSQLASGKLKRPAWPAWPTR